MHVNHIVQRRGTVRLAPDVLGKHLARHSLSVMTHQVGEQVELARSEKNLLRPARHAARLQVHREIPDLPAKWLRLSCPAKQRPNASE